MPTGMIVNSIAIILGGIIGVRYGDKLSEDLKQKLNLVFALSAMTIGVSSITLMKYMPAVIFATVLGTILGVYFKIGDRIQNVPMWAQALITRNLGMKKGPINEEVFNQMVTLIMIFTAAATGIYGSLDLGITGDSKILIVKSMLDFFVAIIFAANLGIIVPVIAIPQFIVCICGGIILLSNGFRLANIKMFPSAELLPATVLVVPFSYIWLQYILPLF
ncbi:DUF554 family protein [Gemella sp. 19428wG2_WT2a]|nr:DUF554 family protein [Gemella sp. 19428wG2_WT2a]TFU60402.1 DUF554 family protein [Gemella sp. WT2a]